jgi:hypothetical protein
MREAPIQQWPCVRDQPINEPQNPLPERQTITVSVTKVTKKVLKKTVTEILHARILAVAIMSARGVNDAERSKLLGQWERVSFRIFGLYGKDARTKVGEYVRLAAKIVSEDIETRTYNQIMAKLQSLGADFPIVPAVEQALSTKDIYEEAPDVCRYVLWQYEEHLAQALGSGATVDEHERVKIWKRRAIDSIEHVFPQSPWGVAEWSGKMSRPGEPEENLYFNLKGTPTRGRVVRRQMPTALTLSNTVCNARRVA